MFSPSCSVSRALLGGAMLLLAAAHLGAQASPPASTATVLSLPITFSGEIRSRTEWDAPGGAAAADVFTLLRSRFGARVDPVRGMSVVLQLQDSRVLGTEGNRVSSTVDVFDLHQGYLQLVTPWRGAEVGLRAGRQEIALGNERLVGAVNWSNTGRVFDGARVMFAPPGPVGADRWSTTAFAAVMEENGRRFGGAVTPSAPLPDHLVFGAFASRGAPGKPGGHWQMPSTREIQASLDVARYVRGSCARIHITNQVARRSRWFSPCSTVRA